MAGKLNLTRSFLFLLFSVKEGLYALKTGKSVNDFFRVHADYVK